VGYACRCDRKWVIGRLNAGISAHPQRNVLERSQFVDLLAFQEQTLAASSDIFEFSDERNEPSSPTSSTGFTVAVGFSRQIAADRSGLYFHQLAWEKLV
jgi:hypothetical protein